MSVALLTIIDLPTSTHTGVSEMAGSLGEAGAKVPEPDVQAVAGVAKGAAAFAKMGSSLMKTVSRLRMLTHVWHCYLTSARNWAGFRNSCVSGGLNSGGYLVA